MLCGTGCFSASLIRTSAAQLLSLQRHTLQIRIGKHTFIRKNAKLVHGQTIKLMLSNVGVSDFLILPIKLLLIHALNCFYCHVCVKMIYGDHLTKDLFNNKAPKAEKKHSPLWITVSYWRFYWQCNILFTFYIFNWGNYTHVLCFYVK